MTSDDSLRGLFLRNIRRAIEKAKASGATVFAVQRARREPIELELEALNLLLTLCEELHAKLGNTETNRDQMLAKLHGIDAAIERGWPGLLDAMVDPVAALDIIASPSKLADWRRRQPRAFFGKRSEPVAEDTLQALAQLEPRGWYVHEDTEESEPWAASNGDMTAIAPTPELLLRAIGMCSEGCPVVHIQADGRLACECNEPGGQTHEFACPLRPTNAAGYAYAVEVGQA